MLRLGAARRAEITGFPDASGCFRCVVEAVVLAWAACPSAPSTRCAGLQPFAGAQELGGALASVAVRKPADAWIYQEIVR